MSQSNRIKFSLCRTCFEITEVFRELFGEGLDLTLNKPEPRLLLLNGHAVLLYKGRVDRPFRNGPYSIADGHRAHSSRRFESFPARCATVAGDIVAMFFLPSAFNSLMMGASFSISSSRLIVLSSLKMRNSVWVPTRFRSTLQPYVLFFDMPLIVSRT